MSYQPKTWENKPSTASPINATNLNHMEGGIKTNDDNIIGALNAILTLQGEMLQAQGDISALETLVDSIFPIDTASGNPAVITDAFGGACKSLELTLEPIQSGSGTPSPQNVRPISGRTQSVVTRTGKNVCSSAYVYNGTGQYATVLYCDGNLKPDTTYTFSFVTNSGNVYYTNDNVFTSTVVVPGTGNRISFTATTKSTLAKVAGQYIEGQGFMILKNSISQPNAPSFTDVQVEVGSTTTPYEPYNGETYVIDLDGTRYGGTVDFKTGAMSVTHLIATYDGSEDESWSMYGTGSASAYAVIGRLPSVAEFTPNVLGVLTTNYLENISAQATWGNYDYFISQSNAMTGIDFVIGLKNISTSVNALKTYLAEHPLTICYKLATPTTVQLTPEEVTLLKGDNVLTTDADSIEASYSADIALYIAKKIAEGSNNRSLAKGGSEEKPKEDVKEEEIEEPKKEETR